MPCASRCTHAGRVAVGLTATAEYDRLTVTAEYDAVDVWSGESARKWLQGMSPVIRNNTHSRLERFGTTGTGYSRNTVVARPIHAV